MPGEKGISFFLTCFDWQEQSALVSVTFQSADLSLTAEMLADVMSPGNFPHSSPCMQQTAVTEQKPQESEKNGKQDVYSSSGISYFS